MTTIAYKDGVIAFDSRVCTSDNRIATLDYNKSRKAGGVKFFFAGVMADIEEFMLDYLSGEYEGLRPLDCVTFIIDQGQLYLSGVNEDGHLWRDPWDLWQHAALGSGSSHALTAMDLGCDAKTAVKMAMLRDSCTGGQIRTYRISGYKDKTHKEK